MRGVGLENHTTVVIPAFNEEDTIREVVLGVRKSLPDASILVIDDGSSDATASIAREAGAKVISHPLNKGNGAAIKTALRTIDGGLVAVLDGDGQHDPEDLPTLLNGLNNYDLVVGARSFTTNEGIRLEEHRQLHTAQACLVSCGTGHSGPDFRIPSVSAPYRGEIPAYLPEWLFFPLH